jgi:DHA1 family multidrug resistance protein-like MFS transporter
MICALQAAENCTHSQPRSTGKKCWLTFTIMLLTTSIYMGSSIWAPAIEQGAEYFHVGLVASTLGISLFVLGYATGPLFLSPITEIPAIGRTSPYIVTLLVYCVLQLPNALVTNFPGFCVLRFLSGFVGSPALATGGESVARRATEQPHHLSRIEPKLTRFLPAGASLSDTFAPHKLPYAMALYNLAAASAPGLGPILSGFAVDVLGWRWAFWEMLLLSAGSLIILSFTMPEVSDTIERAHKCHYYLPSVR